MKLNKILLVLAAATGLLSCDNQLDTPLLGASLSPGIDPTADNALDLAIIPAYASLNGVAIQSNTDFFQQNNWRGAPSNWTYGTVVSDNSYKGSTFQDQQQIINLETYNADPSNDYLDYRWSTLTDGVVRANVAIRLLNQFVENGDFSSAEVAPFLGESFFLRAHYHFENRKIFGNIPYVTEFTNDTPPNFGNNVWASLESDMQTAINNLPTTSAGFGRVNSWTAKAYLARIHMYQNDYDAAKPLLDDIINNGPYSLNADFNANFDANSGETPETVFAVQYSVDDTFDAGLSANFGEVLNFILPDSEVSGGDCCGFNQPSHNLVNAYKTDSNGLPFLDGSFNDENINNVDPNDDSPSGFPDDNNFVEYTGNLDPRLDFTVGRKGIPFLDWGDHPGNTWIRDEENGGPYIARKIYNTQEQQDSVTPSSAWNGWLNTTPTHIIRYAEILLWRAEVAAAEGDLGTAANFVNQIRRRAANSQFWVKNDDGSNAANYVIGEYSGFSSQQEAMLAIEFEHRLELAMEGHRFFDLVRRGRAETVLNEYTRNETERNYLGSNVQYRANDSIFPIPTRIINLTNGVIRQNPGF